MQIMIALLVCFACSGPMVAETLHPRFEQYTIVDGLPGNDVGYIFQDSRGFIWICTRNGLARYDGYSFKHFKHDPENPKTISHNNVAPVNEDIHGNLWIGTHGEGLCRYDYERETFRTFRHDPSDPNSICGNYAQHIFTDSQGGIWFSTYSGTSRLLPEQMNGDSSSWKIFNYPYFKNKPNDATNFIAEAFYEHPSGTIWIGTRDNRLLKFDYKSNHFEKLLHMDIRSINHHPADSAHYITLYASEGIYRYNVLNNTLTRSERPLNTFITNKGIDWFTRHCVKNDGTVWTASLQHGLVRTGPDGNCTRYSLDTDDAFSLKNDKILRLFEDKQGILWIGTFGGGVYKLVREKQNFAFFPVEINRQPVTIYSFLEDCRYDGRVVWLGSRSRGLIKWNRRSGSLTHFPGKFKWAITALYQDEQHPEKLLVGSLGQGVYIFNTNNEQFYRCDFSRVLRERKLYEEFGHVSDFTTAIIPRNNGGVWIATLFGLITCDPGLKSYQHDLPQSRPQNIYRQYAVSCIYDDHSDSSLWVGTRYDGLKKIDIEAKTRLEYRHDPLDPTSIDNNYIGAVYKDKNGYLWVGTQRGLNRYNKDLHTFTRFRDKANHLSVEIFGILGDETGHLWINTKSGLYRFQPDTKELRRYDSRDGLEMSVFSRFAFYKDNKGQIFLGGSGGFVIFHPDHIQKNTYVPPVRITNFTVNNKTVHPGPDAPLQKSIVLSEPITLSPGQSVFSFEFAALDYTTPSRNRYAYMLEGVNKDWVYTDASRRFAGYTHLDPGAYTFRVKGSNNDGIWNEEGVKVNITILPPWYKSTLAYIFYFVFFIILLYALRRYDLRRQRLKQQLTLEHEHAEKLKEVDRMKSRFFANISHEFRSPITLIATPIAQMIRDEFSGNLKEGYRLIQRNAKKLLWLVNQVLSLSKLEAGQLKLKVMKGDIVSFVDRIFNAFLSLAELRRIDFRFKNDVGTLEMYFDEEKLEMVLNNLLANAFKYTPEGGRIVVTLQAPNLKHQIPNKSQIPISKFLILNSNFIAISILNTGPGIPYDEQPRIFDRFYQGQNASQAGGTGIGLSLAKDLTDLHHGSISVESIPDKQTIFTLILPADDGVYRDDEKVSPENLPEVPEDRINRDVWDEEVEGKKKEEKGKKSCVLVVEDNKEMRRYLRKNLETDYQVLEAEDGLQGYEKALEELPELIISDVMMPEMDGITLCEKLKNDPNTGHIPVILLTARAGHEDKLTALKTGADDYIPKPFELEELITRSDNLIRQRRALRERFRKEALFGLGGVVTSPGDQETVENIQNIIEQNLDNPDYGNADFARDLGMSRAQLHRRLNALCGLPPHEFIRLCRLKKAAALLQAKAGSVTYIAYEVGFKNISHFSRLFEKQFGIRPSNFS